MCQHLKLLYCLQTIVWKNNLICFIRLCWTLSSVLWQGICCVIYNAMIMLAINCRDVSLYRFPQSFKYFCDINLSLGHVGWKSRHVDSFLLFLLCWHLYWPIILIQMPVTLSSLCSCDLNVAVSVLFLVIMQILLFFYFSWQFHYSLQSHPWMTSMSAVPSIPLALLMASCGKHTLTDHLMIHCLVFLNLSFLLSSILTYPCMHLLHW